MSKSYMATAVGTLLLIAPFLPTLAYSENLSSTSFRTAAEREFKTGPGEQSDILLDNGMRLILGENGSARLITPSDNDNAVIELDTGILQASSGAGNVLIIRAGDTTINASSATIIVQTGQDFTSALLSDGKEFSIRSGSFTERVYRAGFFTSCDLNCRSGFQTPRRASLSEARKFTESTLPRRDTTTTLQGREIVSRDNRRVDSPASSKEALGSGGDQNGQSESGESSEGGESTSSEGGESATEESSVTLDDGSIAEVLSVDEEADSERISIELAEDVVTEVKTQNRKIGTDIGIASGIGYFQPEGESESRFFDFIPSLTSISNTSPLTITTASENSVVVDFSFVDPTGTAISLIFDGNADADKPSRFRAAATKLVSLDKNNPADTNNDTSIPIDNSSLFITSGELIDQEIGGDFSNIPEYSYLDWGTIQGKLEYSAGLLEFPRIGWVAGAKMTPQEISQFTGSATYVGHSFGSVQGQGLRTVVGTYQNSWDFGKRSGTVSMSFDGSKYSGTTAITANGFTGSMNAADRNGNLRGEFYRGSGSNLQPAALGGSFNIISDDGNYKARGIVAGERVR